jgi:2'-5' RNA ligase
MTTTQAMIRVFIAVELPPDVQDALKETQERISRQMGQQAGALRWTRPEGLHLTLQFLGNVSLRFVALVKGALDKACVGAAPFTLSTGEPGVFPNERRPRVLWLGVHGDVDALRSLASSVHRQMQTLGYQPDHSFSPHLTLARVKGHAGEDVRQALANALAGIKAEPVTQVSFPVTAVSLMQSELRPGGSIYTRLRSIELDAG